ncbi:MAG: hypothetical protein ACLT74_09060, partial [Christensenellales bacterium]
GCVKKSRMFRCLMPSRLMTLSHGSVTEQYGLRICRQMTADGGYKYALILSDGTKESSMVLE